MTPCRYRNSRFPQQGRRASHAAVGGGAEDFARGERSTGCLVGPRRCWPRRSNRGCDGTAFGANWPPITKTAPSRCCVNWGGGNARKRCSSATSRRTSKANAGCRPHGTNRHLQRGRTLCLVRGGEQESRRCTQNAATRPPPTGGWGIQCAGPIRCGTTTPRVSTLRRGLLRDALLGLPAASEEDGGAEGGDDPRASPPPP
jgi:hypothetical protein